MTERQKRLHEVFQHLRKHFGIHTQTDFANALQYSRVYISAALNGADKNLTDSLFKSICEAFPNTFNIDYLLHGEGELLADEAPPMERPPSPVIDQSSMVNAIIATYEGRIADLKESNADLRSSLKQKDDQIADLRATVDDLRARLADLQNELQNINRTYLDYPFPVGAADHPKRHKNV